MWNSFLSLIPTFTAKEPQLHETFMCTEDMGESSPRSQLPHHLSSLSPPFCPFVL